MMEHFYIILFLDGCFQIYPLMDNMRKENFQAGARLFKVRGDVQIFDLSDWVGRNYNNSKFQPVDWND